MRIILLLLILSTALLSQNDRPEYVLKDSERIIKSGSQAIRWGNQYTWILEGDLIIEKGAKLIIDAGTTIKFRPNTDKGSTGKDPNKCEVIVRGELIAIGKPSQNQRITFTSAAPEGKERAGDWYGIIIYKNNKTTRIQNTDVYYGHRGISCFGSSPIIQNSQILYSYNTGIYLTAKSNAQIQSNMITSNSYAGIEVVMRSTPKISENTIQSNEYGIMIYDSSEPNLGSTDSENSNVGQNNISGNFTYDLYNHSIKSIKAENNSWGSTNIEDIQKTIFDKRTHPSYGMVDIQPISSTTQAEFQRQALQSQNIIAAATPNTRRSTTSNRKPVNRPTTSPQKTTTKTTTKTTNTSTKQKTTPSRSSNTAVNDSTRLANNNQTKTNAKTTTSQSDNNTTNTTSNNSAQLASNNQEQQENKTSTTNVEEVEKAEEPKNNFTIQSQTKPFFTFQIDPGTGLETVKGEPEYTGAAKAQNITGRVTLKIVIAFDGSVESAQVLRSPHPSLDQLAIDAAMKHRFSIGTVQGQPVRFEKTIAFKF